MQAAGFHCNPPKDWNSLVKYPNQTSLFADAMRPMGYIPYYVIEGTKTALVQIRDPLGRGGSPLGRAYVYPANEDAEFINEIITQLKGRSIPFVRFGNTMWGLRTSEALKELSANITERHTFRIDLSLTENDLIKNMSGAERKIRKALKSGIEVKEGRSQADLKVFAALCHETNLRIQGRGAISLFPLAFYETLFSQGSKVESPLLLLALHKGLVVAGNLFLTQGDTMLYYQGGSTRDRDATPLQAPAACFWHAILAAKSRGLRTFDFGGCSPDLPSTDSRHGVYQYKKMWGGTLETFYTGEKVISPLRYRFQQRVTDLFWNRVQPAYFHMLKLRDSLWKASA